jgi:hypothetical protein
MSPSIADLLLNRPVALPDGTTWRYRKRRSVESAEARQVAEMQRKRAKRQQAKVAEAAEETGRYCPLCDGPERAGCHCSGVSRSDVPGY